MSDFVSQLISNYPLLPLHLTHHLEKEFINVKNVTSMKNMKKKVLLISLFLVATVVASFQFSSEKENLQSLMLENIDALASGEWGELLVVLGPVLWIVRLRMLRFML